MDYVLEVFPAYGILISDPTAAKGRFGSALSFQAEQSLQG
jgi:hypothetical protein